MHSENKSWRDFADMFWSRVPAPTPGFTPGKVIFICFVPYCICSCPHANAFRSFPGGLPPTAGEVRVSCYLSCTDGKEAFSRERSDSHSFSEYFHWIFLKLNFPIYTGRVIYSVHTHLNDYSISTAYNGFLTIKDFKQGHCVHKLFAFPRRLNCSSPHVNSNGMRFGAK